MGEHFKETAPSARSTEGNTLDRSPGRPASDFEWPPRDEVLDNQVFRFDRARTGSAPTPGTPADNAAALAPEPPEKFVASLMERLKAAPEPSEADERRARGTAAPPTRARSASGDQTSKRSWPLPFPAIKWPTWSIATTMSRRALAIAVVALALIALLEAAFIARMLWSRPADTSGGETRAAAAVSAVPVSPASTASRNTATGTSGARSTEPGSTPSRGNGRLVIRSDPSGAQVAIDGRKYGLTPLTLPDVKPGEYRLTLTRGGSEVRQTVRVEAGAVVSVVAPLQAPATSGWLALASPIELDVFERGALLGTSRSSQIMLEAGSHALELVNDTLGFRQQQAVRIEPGKLVRVPIELPAGTININATPWAEVYIDGKLVGETPIGRLSVPIGMHEVVFRHPELGEKTITAAVKVGVPTRLSADLRK